jgi:hypothetical protein
MIYIVFMTLYNRYALHLHGFDQIPSPPPQVSKFFSAIGEFFMPSTGGRGLNPSSHHWGGGSAGGRGQGGLGVGGSRFGSGARREGEEEEEEAMLGGQEEEDVGADLGDADVSRGGNGNPWSREQGSGGGGVVDPAGIIRL